METDKDQWPLDEPITSDLNIEEIPTIDLNSFDSMMSDPMNMSYSVTGAQGSSIPAGSYTINTSQLNGTSGSYFYANPTITVGSAPHSSLQVTGDADFEGDVKIKGRSIVDMIETIEKRLAILVPDPEKLEHFESLKKAYEHYKTLEALCQLPKKENK